MKSLEELKVLCTIEEQTILFEEVQVDRNLNLAYLFVTIAKNPFNNSINKVKLHGASSQRDAHQFTIHLFSIVSLHLIFSV